MCITCGCAANVADEPAETAQQQAHSATAQDRDGDGPHHHHHHHAQDGHHHQLTGINEAAAKPAASEVTAQYSHAVGLSATRTLKIEQDILAKNNAYAQQNRDYFAAHGIFALNLVSSPGSGKTCLLVETIAALQGKLPLAVIEGDQQTALDAERIQHAGAAAVQINTGKGCHLDAHLVAHAVEQLATQQQLADDSVLFIENVGNLVCPAAFDLGEAHKVVILSVTEGEDKPLKYPDMFRAADLMILNKCDLLPHLDFDVAQVAAHAKRVNPNIKIIQLSARSGAGMDRWLQWLQAGSMATIATK